MIPGHELFPPQPHEHQLMPETIPMSRASRTYTNLGAGPTESTVDDRIILDARSGGAVRIVIRVSTAGTTGVLKAQYSVDDAASWADLTATASLAATGVVASAYQAVPFAARGDLLLVRFVAGSGDGIEDPVVGPVMLHVREPRPS